MKVKAIEDFDARFLGPLLSGLSEMGEGKILIAPDHPTPLEKRTHVADPVPFLISTFDLEEGEGGGGFDEDTAAASGILIEEGHLLLDRLLGNG